MPKIFTRNFGPMEYAVGEEFAFPDGLPGFPSETAFLPIEIPDQLPLVYLQSLRTPDLCFVALPARCIVADYRLSTAAEDLASVGLSPEVQPGPEVLCLALLCFGEDGGVTANLRAPMVINVKSRVGGQLIQVEDRYPIRFRLEPGKEAAVCS